MIAHSFYDVGPRVFISYSFKDKETASQVHKFLTSFECRVRMEDEVSLIGHRLDLILPERIREAEAFVQLRTASALSSRWVMKELECASAPREGDSQPVLVPVAFERGDIAALPNASGPIDATSGLSDQVLELIGMRIAEAVRALPLSDADPFSFEPDALDRALRAAPADHRRVIVDSDGRLLQWIKDSLAYIETSDAPHKNNWLRQEQGRQKQLIRFLQDLDKEAAKLIACLAEAYDTWKCPFPGRAAHAMDYFCLVRVGLAVVQRAFQLPANHELLSNHGRIFASLLERLPRDPDVEDAYLNWIAEGDRVRTVPSDEDRAALDALSRVDIDDKTFKHFVQEAKEYIPDLLRRVGRNDP